MNRRAGRLRRRIPGRKMSRKVRMPLRKIRHPAIYKKSGRCSAEGAFLIFWYLFTALLAY